MAWKREETSTMVVGWDMTRASDEGGTDEAETEDCGHWEQWEEPKRAHTASWQMIDAQMG